MFSRFEFYTGTVLKWAIAATLLLLLTACGSSSGGQTGAGFFEGRGFAVGAGESAGPLSPVEGGAGNPVSFGPNTPVITPSPTPSATPGGPATGKVIYAVSSSPSEVVSIRVSPDGTLSSYRSGLTSSGNISELFLGLDGTSAYGADYDGNRIYTYRLQPSSAELTALGDIAAGDYPSDFGFVANILYVTNANPAGFYGTNTVTSFIVAANGLLSLNPNSPTISTGLPIPLGGAPQSISIHPDGTRAFVANRDGRSIAVYNIGPLGELSHVAGSPFPVSGPINNAQVSKDGRFLFANFFGAGAFPLGRTITYDITSTGLTELSTYTWPTGTPYGVLEHPLLPVLYITGNDQLSSFTIAANGSLSPLAGSAPLSVNGAFKAVFEQNHELLFTVGDGIVSFRIASDGVPTLVDTYGTLGFLSAIVVPES